MMVIPKIAWAKLKNRDALKEKNGLPWKAGELKFKITK
jgi:hypothetical protein